MLLSLLSLTPPLLLLPLLLLYTPYQLRAACLLLTILRLLPPLLQRLRQQDIFPGADRFLQPPVRVAKHDPQNSACDAERVCAICLEEFAEGSLWGHAECRHQFRESLGQTVVVASSMKSAECVGR